MNNAYVMMGNRDIDLLRCLSLSKSIRDSGSGKNIAFLSFDNLNTYKYKTIIDNLDISIIETTNPIDLSKITNEYYIDQISDISWDFIKLVPWSLTAYESIIFMDTDMLVLQNIDHLFDLDYDFIYTDGRISPLNSGLFVLRPNLTTLYGLQQFVYNAYFNIYDGWYKMGRVKKHYAIEVCQGILYYFFVKSQAYRTQYIPRQIYNNMSPQCYDSVSEDQIKVVHFTSWKKPPILQSEIKHEFQKKIHNLWNQNIIDLGL